jgi:hypothetical protein
MNMLVKQRYILREDGGEIIRRAENSDVPTLADIPSDIPDNLKFLPELNQSPKGGGPHNTLNCAVRRLVLGSHSKKRRPAVGC